MRVFTRSVLTRSLLVFGLMLAGAGFAQSLPAQGEASPAFVAASHYAARFDPGLKSIRFMPLSGGDSIVPIPASCEGAKLAPGVWYVGQDLNGQLVLRAPSSTTLAADQPSEIDVGVCGAGNADKQHFNVPASAWQFLAANVGAIYVGN